MLKIFAVAVMERGMKVCAAAAIVAGLVLAGSAAARQDSGAQQTPPAKTQKPPAAGAATGSAASGATTKKAPSSTGATAKAGTGTTHALTTRKDKLSYAIGMNFGRGLKAQPIEVDPATVAQGVKDALSGGKTALTDDEAKAVLTELQGEMRTKQEALMQQLGSTNKKEGEAFLAANKTKEGVVTLPSGLQYKIVKEGNGSKPSASDTVVCNYRGTLINGKEFDSSYKRGQPATFPVSGVIKGWTEALQLMPVGSKWELYIPSEMAYGERGAGPDIGPGATLVFEVELLSIQGKK